MKESKSKIRISMITGERLLNDCLTPQSQWVELQIEIAHKRYVEVAMSMSQFASMLSSNMSTSCTINRMFDHNGNVIEDKPEKPKEVSERLSDNLKKNDEGIDKRMSDLESDIYELVNSKSISKKKLKEALSDLQTIRSHYKSNKEYYMKEAKAEIEKISEEQKVQLLNSIYSQSDDAKRLIEKHIPNLKALTHNTSDTPEMESYESKERELKDVKDMTSMEVANSIHSFLKKYENNKELNLFGASCFEDKGKIHITYVSYQGSTHLPLKEAKEYLSFLQTSTFQKHYALKGDR